MGTPAGQGDYDVNRTLNIAIDVDDTLAMTFEHMQPYVAEYFGADVEELRSKGISYENLPEAWLEKRMEFNKAYLERVVPDTPFRPDAAWAVDTLRARGHRVIVMTARTTKFYTDPFATTAEQLRRGGIAYDKLLCAKDKAGACLQEQIDVLIDDLPRNCEAVAAIGVKVINMVSPVFRDVQTPYPRAHSWKEAVDMILRMEQASE